MPIAAEFGDVDNDGDLDLVICAGAVPPSASGSVHILRNGGTNAQGHWNGFNSVSTPMATGSAPISLALGRFDSDAYLDIVVANQGGNSISKFRNNATGDGSFASPTTTSITAPTAVAAGTFFTTWDDVVVTKSSGSVVVQSFTAAGGFAAAPVNLTGGIGPRDVSVVDLDSDGDEDIAVMNVNTTSDATSVGVHRFDSKLLTFAAVVANPAGTVATDFHLSDLNSDGFADALVAHLSGSMSIVVNRGDGTGEYFAPIAIPMGSNLTSISTLDVEPDGDQDVVAVMGTGASAVIRLARNDLNGGQTIAFSEFSDLVVGEHSALVRTGDLNGDDVEDLLSVNAGFVGFASGSNDIVVASRLNGDAVPACTADIAPVGGDGQVNVNDLLAIINSWGPCPAPPNPCPTDIAPDGGDGAVNVNDLLRVINTWGLCP